MLMESLAQMLEVPGNSGILFRRTYPELEHSLIIESMKMFPPAICKYNDQKHRWTIRTSGADSHLWFGFCEHEEDVYRYQSAQWGFLGLDESTHFTEFQFTYLYGRVRSVIPGCWPRARLTSNPGNIGHHWHKKYFSIGKVPGDTTWRPPRDPKKSLPEPSRCFIPATLMDNPILMQNDPGYVARLEGLPENIRKMLLDGSWESFAGQYFTDWNAEIHMCRKFDIPKFWKIYRAVDFGFAAPFCCLWFAVAPNKHVFMFREIYQSGLRDKEQATQIKSLSMWNLNEPMAIEYTVGDPSMRQKKSDTGVSAQENYLKSGVAVVAASNARVPGWMALRNLLAIDPATGTPWLQVFDNCVNFKREMEEAVVDDKNPEDLDSDGSDHAIDAARYFAASRPEAAEDPESHPDIYKGMDNSTAAEWRNYHNMLKSGDKSRGSTVPGLNREE